MLALLDSNSGRCIGISDRFIQGPWGLDERREFGRDSSGALLIWKYLFLEFSSFLKAILSDHFKIEKWT